MKYNLNIQIKKLKNVNDQYKEWIKFEELQ